MKVHQAILNTTAKVCCRSQRIGRFCFIMFPTSEIFVLYNKSGNANGTFEIRFLWSHNIYYQYSTHSPSEGDFNFYRRRYFLHIFSYGSFVRVLQMGERSLPMHITLHVMCLLFFVQYYPNVRYVDRI